MFGLADVNSFYASCEKVFRPDLKGCPVVVLSNNDGCCIARSPDYMELKVNQLIIALWIIEKANYCVL